MALPSTSSLWPSTNLPFLATPSISCIDFNDPPHHTKSIQIQSLSGWFIVYQKVRTHIYIIESHTAFQVISYLSYASCLFIMNHESFLTHPSPTFLKSLWRCKTSRPKAPTDVQLIQLESQPPWRSVCYMEENMAPYPSSPGVFFTSGARQQNHRHSTSCPRWPSSGTNSTWPFFRQQNLVEKIWEKNHGEIKLLHVTVFKTLAKAAIKTRLSLGPPGRIEPLAPPAKLTKKTAQNIILVGKTPWVGWRTHPKKSNHCKSDQETEHWALDGRIRGKGNRKRGA